MYAFKPSVAFLLGVAPGIVSQIALVKPRTLSVWVGKFNASGIDGLMDRPRPGRLRRKNGALATNHTP